MKENEMKKIYLQIYKCSTAVSYLEEEEELWNRVKY